MHPPPFLMSHRLLDWPDCHLEVHCCKGVTVWPVRLLHEKHGNHTFESLLKRLRCSQCRRFRPAPVYLCAGRSREFAGGAAPDWAIELIAKPNLR